uniref:Kazal-like domain-containing protein n=1 Tax=Plectus sambesii TaxID=2011161 RepID=A0A914XIF0_9BILA
MDATCAGTEPMCDSDGETHENICGFEHKRCLAMKQQRRNITVAHEGECCAQQACKEEYKPVCDSLGVTHPSMCEFESRKCRYDKMHKNSTMQFAYKGECCDQTCETDWQPVCDQHGALYKNKCDFAVRSCEADRRNGAILLQAPCPARQARRSLRNYLNHL